MEPAQDFTGQALFVHGFTGSPYELRPLAEFLNSQGFSAFGKKLSGHTGSLEALDSVHAETWLREIELWRRQCLVDPSTGLSLIHI